MNRSICWLTLDMNRRDGQCSVSLGQGETGRTLKFRLYENGAPYTIPEGCYVIISGVMDNNHDGVSESTIYNDCYIQDGVVCYDITDATALGTVGVMNCQLQIMSVDGGCVCSPKFQIVVHSAVYDKETVEGSEQFFALQKILEGLSQGGGGTGGSSGGGMEIVTVSGTTPSMSSQEIYEKHQNGVAIYLECGLPNGNTVLLDLASSTETQAVFTHTEVDVDDNNTKTYKGQIFGNYFVSFTIPQAFAESSGGGSLPLTGKTVILFGEDFDAYKSYIGDYISQLTGANVINAGISNTTMSTCCLTSELNAFSGEELIRAYASGNYEKQETALSSEAFPQTLDNARCQAVIDELKASPRDEVAIFVSYGKNDLSAGATLKNESSLYDSSTIYGAFLSAESTFNLLKYSTLTLCSPLWSFHYVLDIETLVPTYTALEDYENETTGIKGSEIVAPIKEVAELYRAPFVDLMNYGWSKQSMYSKFGGQTSAYGWKHLGESDNYVLSIARIIARELI